MKIKNILSDYRNNKNESKLNIKAILDEYKSKNSIKQSETLKEIIINALSAIEKEFTDYNSERIAKTDFKDIQFSLLVYNEEIQEYIYRITLKKENNIPIISIISYEINNGNIESANEEKISILEDKKFSDESNIRNDFYTKYRNFLMSKLQ